MVMLPIYYAVSFTLFYGVFSYFLLTWRNIRHLHDSKVKTLQKQVYSEEAPFRFVSFFSFLQKLANSHNVYTWIPPSYLCKWYMSRTLFLTFRFYLIVCHGDHSYLMLYWGFSRESARVCEGWQVPRSAGWVDMPETQENQTNDIIPILRPAGSRPRKSCCCSLSLKAGKIQCSSPKAVWQKAAHALGRVSVFPLCRPLRDWMQLTSWKRNLYSVCPLSVRLV